MGLFSTTLCSASFRPGPQPRGLGAVAWWVVFAQISGTDLARESLPAWVSRSAGLPSGVKVGSTFVKMLARHGHSGSFQSPSSSGSPDGESLNFGAPAWTAAVMRYGFNAIVVLADMILCLPGMKYVPHGRVGRLERDASTKAATRAGDRPSGTATVDCMLNPSASALGMSNPVLSSCCVGGSGPLHLPLAGHGVGRRDGDAGQLHPSRHSAILLGGDPACFVVLLAVANV